MPRKWSEVEADADYMSLSESDKRAVKEAYFDRVIAADSEYRSLAPDDQKRAREMFLPGPTLWQRVKGAAKAAVEPIPALVRLTEPAISKIPDPGQRAVESVESMKPQSVIGQAARLAALGMYAAPQVPSISTRRAARYALQPSPVDLVSMALPAVPRIARAFKGKAPPPTASAPAPVATPGAPSPPPTPVVAPTPAAASEAISGSEKSAATMKTVVDEVSEQLSKGAVIPEADGVRIFRRLASSVRSGIVSVEQGARAMGLDPADIPKTADDMAEFIERTSTASGRELAQLSRLTRNIKSVLKDNPAAMAELEKPLTMTERAVEGFRGVENFRRGMMVLQTMTGMRNLISQGFRTAIQGATDAATGVLLRASGAMPKDASALSIAAADGISALNAMRERAPLVLDILKKYPTLESRLLKTPFSDVSMSGKLMKKVGFINAWQEGFFRKMAADARFNRNLMLRGIRPEDARFLKPETLRPILEDSVEHALKMTFAQGAKTGPGKLLLQAYQKMPFLSAVAHPFPRFWLNAIEFIWEHQPLQIGRAVLPSSYKTAEGAEALAKGFTGLAMTGAAYALDKAGLVGEKWYDFKAGDKRIDARAYAVFAPYMFMGRFINNMQKYGMRGLDKFSMEDLSQAFVSMKRTDLTGVALLDAFLSSGGNKSFGRFKDTLVNMASAWTASFTTPLRTASDIAGQFAPQEALQRNVRTEALGGLKQVAQAPLQNIPGAARLLPEAASPLKSGPMRREAPILRQATGIALRTPTLVEREAERLGLGPRNLYPSLGDKDLNNAVVARMGKYTEQFMTPVLANPMYAKLPDVIRKQIFSSILSAARATAFAEVQATSGGNPDMMMAIAKARMNEVQRFLAGMR